MNPDGPPIASVDFAAGVWAVVAVLLVAAILAAALRPLIPRSKEQPVCAEPDSGGAHPLGPPGPGGARECACGVRRLVPVRSDTRELAIPDTPAAFLAAATGHPSSRPLEQLPTDETPMLHLVWPPRRD